MYPINAASPERIAIGAVILIADGTVQTSGVAVTVRGQGGAEAGSAGTIAYGASGIVYYTPTQAETNFTSFVLIASKASCIPVAITVITTASGTAGYAGLDWGLMLNKTTTNDLSGTNIKTNQVVASVSGAVGSVTGAVGSVTGAVGSVTGNVGGNVTGSVGSVVGAVGSVTGAVGSVTGAVGSVTGNVGGNVTGSVGSVVGAVGSVTATVNADTKKMNGTTVNGTGVAGDLWRG